MSARDLAAVVDDLAAVFVALHETDDADRRVELKERQEALRAEAAELRASLPLTGVDEDQLRARLARLEAARDRHLSAHLTASAAAQTGMGGGIDPEHVHELHRQMDEAVGLAAIEDEIRRLRTQLP